MDTEKREEGSRATPLPRMTLKKPGLLAMVRAMPLAEEVGSNDFSQGESGKGRC